MGQPQRTKSLNAKAQEVQAQIENVMAQFTAIESTFIDGARYDYRRFGVLGEIASKTPVVVYDLPELVDVCSTAFVDRSGKMFIAADFARRGLHEHENDQFSLYFLVMHELEHLRRFHLHRMLDFPDTYAGRAQDARINVDLVRAEAAARQDSERGALPGRELDEQYVKSLLDELSGTIVGTGIAMNWEDHKRYIGLSEEAIAAMMMRDDESPAQIPNREISFPSLMEAAAGEADRVKDMLRAGIRLPPSNADSAVLTPAALSGLSHDMRAVGQAKASRASITDEQIAGCLSGLVKLKQHQGVMELDLRHERGQMAVAATGGSHASGTSGDAYLDVLRPSDRLKLAENALQGLLQAQAGRGAGKDSSSPTIKDLERSLGRGAGERRPQGRDEQPGGQADSGAPSASVHAAAGSEAGSKRPGAGSASGPQGQGFDMVPSPNAHSSDQHVMETEDLVKLLNEAGVNPSTMERLGFSDLQAMQQDAHAAQANMVSAIHKASTDMQRLGDRYPGAHLLGYAKSKLQQLQQPVLTWQTAQRKILASGGRGMRMDDAEPWAPYLMDHRDMGYDSASDVPYLGSLVPGKLQRPVAYNVHDLSASVSAEMAIRFLSEAVHMAEEKRSRGGIESVNICSDTLMRGDPIIVDEKNLARIRAEGIEINGGGGTNNQAVLEQVLELSSPRRGPRQFRGRPIAMIALWGDLGDAPPDFVRLLRKARECGHKALPPILIIAPKICYRDDYHDEVSKFATMVYIDVEKPQMIKLGQVAQEQRRKAGALEQLAQETAISRPKM